jgi:GDP-L-fucose synthase
MFDLAGRRIWVAGHRGMVGAALVRRLRAEPATTILTVGRDAVDLCRQAAVERWIDANRPDAIIVAAALVGGIRANDTRPAAFLHDNIAIATNIIHAAWTGGVSKLLFLGSSCIYPRDAPQPISEDALLTAPLEPTNQWYALAKIAGLKMCQAYRRQYGCDFIAAMPPNLYGPGDNFDVETGHVLPALIRRIHAAKVEGAEEVVIWGSGTPLREFMFVEDVADALVFLLRTYSDEAHVNVGGGQEISIRGLAERIAAIVGYRGGFRQDTRMPDGTPRKLLDGTRLASLGWAARTPLDEGIRRTYEWFLSAEAGVIRGA